MIILDVVPHKEFVLALCAEKESKTHVVNETPSQGMAIVQYEDRAT
jgi:hypothetical protein